MAYALIAAALLVLLVLSRILNESDEDYCDTGMW
jgi:hypothetical protein